MTNHQLHDYGEVVPYDSTSNNLETNPKLSGHWPLWYIREDPWQKVPELKPDDLKFLITGFDERPPFGSQERFENDRYMRFCLTFDGHEFAVTQMNISDPHDAIAKLTTRILLIGGMPAPGKGTLAVDSEQRFAQFCTVDELRASMFHHQRGHRAMGGDESLLEDYPYLRQMARAIAIQIQPYDPNNDR
jgi:hypothetical protein